MAGGARPGAALVRAGLWWCLRHPVPPARRCWRCGSTSSSAGRAGGAAGAASAVSALWRWRDESSWWPWCAGPLLGRFRQVFVYRRAWREAMTLCGLAETYDHRPVLPQLLRVRSDQALDVLTVRMVRGQTPEDFQQVTANLAYAFGRRHARVYSERPDDPPTRTGYWALAAAAGGPAAVPGPADAGLPGARPHRCAAHGGAAVRRPGRAGLHRAAAGSAGGPAAPGRCTCSPRMS